MHWFLVIILLLVWLQATICRDIVRVAVILHGPSNYNETLATGFEGTFPVDQNPYPLGMVQAYTLFNSRLSAVGGFRYISASSLRNTTSASLDLRYFNVGPLFDSSGSVVTTILRLQALLPKLIDPNSEYGAFTFIVGVPFTYVLQSTMLASFCSSTSACIGFVPTEPAPSTWVCVDQSTYSIENPIIAQPDCADKYPGYRRHPMAWSTMSDPNNLMQTAMGLYRTAGAKTAAVVAFSNGEYDYYDLLNTKASLPFQGLTVVYENLWAMTRAQADPITGILHMNDTTVALLVQELMVYDPDVIFVAMSAGYTPGIVNAALFWKWMKYYNYIPKGICIAQGGAGDIVRNVGAADSMYITGTGGWTRLLRGSAYDANDLPWSHQLFPTNISTGVQSPEVWRASMSAMSGEISPLVGEIFYGIAGFADSIMETIQHAVEQCSGATLAEINCLNTAIAKLSVPSAMGYLQYDNSGRLVQGDVPVAQYQPFLPPSLHGTAIVYPIYAALPLVYPIPTWDERTFVNSLYNTSSELVVATVNTVVIVYCLVLAAFVALYRQHAIIKASMPDFLLLIIAGGILMLLSTYFATLNVTNDFCRASSWLLTIGFTLMFSALFTKTFCVHHIFSSLSEAGGLKVVKVPRSMLYGAVLVFVAIDCVINIVWTTAGPIQIEVITVDPYRPVYNYTQCQTSQVSLRCIIVSLAVKGVGLLCGLVLTWKAKDIPDRFNETTYLCFSIYNVFVCGMFLVPLVAANTGGRLTTYYIRSFGIMLFVFSTLSIMLFYKVYTILTGFSNDKNSSNTSTGQTGSKSAKKRASMASLVASGSGSGSGSSPGSSPSPNNRARSLVSASASASPGSSSSPTNRTRDRDRPSLALTQQQAASVSGAGVANDSNSVYVADPSMRSLLSDLVRMSSMASSTSTSTAIRESLRRLIESTPSGTDIDSQRALLAIQNQKTRGPGPKVVIHVD